MPEFSEHDDDNGNSNPHFSDVPPVHIPLSVEEFEGYRPPEEELSIARHMLDEEIDAARERNADYAFPIESFYPGKQGDVLTLDYHPEDQQAVARFTISDIVRPGVDGQTEERTNMQMQLFDAEGTRSYAYVPTDAEQPAIIRIHGINPSELPGVPESGALPIAEARERYEGAWNAAGPNREFEKDMFPPDYVGVIEAGRVAAMLERAEPQVYPFGSILQSTINRMWAKGEGGELTEAEAQEGARLYLQNMERHLTDPNRPRTAEVHTGDSHLTVHIGESKDGSTPLVNLMFRQPPLPKATELFAKTQLASDAELVGVHTRLIYGVGDGLLLRGCTQSFLDSEGRVIPFLSKVGRANQEDAFALHYFLRKPTI